MEKEYQSGICAFSLLVLPLPDSTMTESCRAAVGSLAPQAAGAYPNRTALFREDAAAEPDLGDSPKTGSWLRQESSTTSQCPKAALGSNEFTELGSKTVPYP